MPRARFFIEQRMAKSLHQLANKHFSGRNCGKVRVIF